MKIRVQTQQPNGTQKQQFGKQGGSKVSGMYGKLTSGWTPHIVSALFLILVALALFIK